uniref:KRAB domain-containing protein n=1 Tax=Catagonus wagneri TaxID=51154 RepID=A0A8C3WGK1_9CETA
HPLRWPLTCFCPLWGKGKKRFEPLSLPGSVSVTRPDVAIDFSPEEWKCLDLETYRHLVSLDLVTLLEQKKDDWEWRQ